MFIEFLVCARHCLAIVDGKVDKITDTVALHGFIVCKKVNKYVILF